MLLLVSIFIYVLYNNYHMYSVCLHEALCQGSSNNNLSMLITLIYFLEVL